MSILLDDPAVFIEGVADIGLVRLAHTEKSGTYPSVIHLFSNGQLYGKILVCIILKAP